MKPLLFVQAEAEGLANLLRDELLLIIRAAVDARGRFTMALSGGSSPRRFHTLLAAQTDLPWDQMHFFFGDDRHVPPQNDESNYKMARETLFARAPIPPQNIHRIETELPSAADAAERYESALRDFFASDATPFPVLDVVLLGLGPDGHTASLFPGTPGLDEKTRWVIANPVAKLKTDRITFTFPVLNAARNVVFLVQGTDKADAVQAVLETQAPISERPARGVQPTAGRTLWFLDLTAAQQLSTQEFQVSSS